MFAKRIPLGENIANCRKDDNTSGEEKWLHVIP